MIIHHTTYKSKNGISYDHRANPKSDTPHQFYNPESHSMIEVLLVLSGSAEYFINGAQYYLETGNLLVINAGEFHTSKVNHLEYYEHINLHFSPNFIPKLTDIDANAPFSNADLYQHLISKEIVEKYKIKEQLLRIETICKEALDEKYKELSIISAIQGVIAELNILYDDLLSNKSQSLLIPKISNTLFQDAIHYINSKISENINVKSVADALGISESYLHRLFKKIMGVSVHSYIQNQKMQYALSLLKKGYYATNVSEMLGYDYYATFFTHFTKVFGNSPSEFK